MAIEGKIIRAFVVVPATEEVGFVPDFIVDPRDIFFDGIMGGSGFDQLVPLVPVLGFFTVRGIGEGKHGFSAGIYNSIDDFVEKRKIIVAVALINIVVVEDMIEADQLRV